MVIGEFHNGSDIPQFTTALFRDLHARLGFNYIALEHDPTIIDLLTAPQGPHRLDSMFTLVRRYPHGLQFRTDQEVEMIAAAAEISTARTAAVWGVDQAWGGLHILEWLERIAPDERARAVARELAAAARATESTRPARHGSIPRWIADAPASDFERLRVAFMPRPGSEADRLIAGMELSNAIYSGRVAPRGVPSSYLRNHIREQQMKTAFAAHYRRAQAAGDSVPKVVARFGHLHATAGINTLDVSTLGNFLKEFARANGRESFHVTVYLINEPNTYWTLFDTPEYVPLAKAGSTREWSIVDLRPLRPYVRANRFEGLSPDLKSVIMGFDAALLIGGGTRGTHTRLGIQ